MPLIPNFVSRARPRLPSNLLALLAVLLVGSRGALAQRANDPSECPYCHGDPALMEKAGIVSHGGFAFGKGDATAKVDGLLATCDIKWIETAHFELGLALGPHKVKQEEKEKIRGELARLQAALPDVDPKMKILDPWLRSHLYAQRVEDHWKRWLEIFQVEDKDFPRDDKPWDMKGKFMGSGPYLGQAGKYEVLLVPNEANLVTYVQNQFGLLTKKSQRWNVPTLHTISVTIHAGGEGLREDEGMHAHLVFNLAINLLDGYKHYSYDTPIWIREGLAHFMEREVSQKFNSFDSAEGSVAETTRKSKWEPEVRKIVSSGKASRLAELMSMKEYSDLTLDRHYATWSMVQFLIQTNPDGWAKFNDALHGITNEHGLPDSTNLPEIHREKFKEHFGYSYAEFDTAWREWVMANYSGQ
jgi:hypothetical protein